MTEAIFSGFFYRSQAELVPLGVRLHDIIVSVKSPLQQEAQVWLEEKSCKISTQPCELLQKDGGGDASESWREVFTERGCQCSQSQLQQITSCEVSA